jgi:hypothetical protein
VDSCTDARLQADGRGQNRGILLAMKLRSLLLLVFLPLIAYAEDTEKPSAVERAANATGRGIDHAAKATGRGVERAAKATGRGLERAAKATARGVERTVDRTEGWVKKKTE